MSYMHFLFTNLLVLILSLGSATAETVTLSIDGVQRSFEHHVPSAQGAMPVILAFHGYGQSAAGMEEMSGLTPLALGQGMIIVYPEGRRARGEAQYWATQSGQDQAGDLAFTRAILDYLKSRHAIDTARIYATGISNGGGMAHMVGAYMAPEIAAIAPVAGAYYEHQARRPRAPVAVLAFHGARDRIVPIEGRAKLPNIHSWARFWAQQNGCSTSPAVLSANQALRRERWGGCAAPVTLVTLANGRHAWPGGNSRLGRRLPVNASQEIVAFFGRH